MKESTGTAEPKVKERLYRQGDLLFQRVSKLPENLQARQSDILAEGETTGHMHRIVGPAQILEGMGQEYLQVEAETELVHEEHNKITLAPGYYKVIHEREFDPLEEWARTVND